MTMTAARAPFGNEIRMGVEVNAYGRPVAYWMWTRHPADIGASGKREHVRVPADEILHDFVTLRPGQSRGVTWFAPVLVNQQMLSAYIEAEITAARVAASNMAAIQYDPEKAGGAMPQAAPGASNIPREVEPGLFMRLGPGESLLSTDFGHPSGAFGPFLKFSSRALSAGLNVAYSSLSGDLEAVNFSSIRAGIIQERDFYRKLQGWTVERLCRRVFRAWLPMAVMAGKLPSDALAVLDQPRAIQWRPRGWPWVDPQSDAAAAQMRISMGLETRTNILAQTSGADFEETLEQLTEEKRLAEEADIDISGKSTAPAPAQQQPAEDEKPAGDEPTDDSEDDTEDAPKRSVTLIRRHGT
jgi:lambda family phage portal protein